MSEFPLLASIDMIYIVNLAFRTDRRAEMAEQLALIGLTYDHPKVTLIAASRPNDPGEFPSIGCRGCFQSHLGILQDALDKGHECILVLEDDASFTRKFYNCTTDQAQKVQTSTWDTFYFGSVLETANTSDLFVPINPNDPLKLTHAIMMRKSAFSKMVPYLEVMLTRKLGDPLGGPMHLDGAYSWFRREHPENKTLATTTQWVTQRSSKTDIHDTGWKERIPLINLARRIKNSLARR